MNENYTKIEVGPSNTTLVLNGKILSDVVEMKLTAHMDEPLIKAELTFGGEDPRVEKMFVKNMKRGAFTVVIELCKLEIKDKAINSDQLDLFDEVKA